jgi:Rrf2 family transcriptional regulator, cysteine metabolism repressor
MLMKVSARGRYGLQLMMELANQYGRGPLQVGSIAERQGLPPKYLPVLLGALKTAGLVTVQRGPTGGCELARHPGRITALEIFEALEGPIEPGPLDREQGLIASSGEQAVGALWTKMGQAMKEVLRSCTLADLAASQLAHEGNNHGYWI